MNESCLGCRVGFHQECIDPQPHNSDNIVLIGLEFTTCCCWRTDVLMPVGKAEVIGGYKQDDEIRDVTSTGRKRAAALFPITDGMPCEWGDLKYAGGGAKPVIGCTGTLIYAAKGKGAVHHGPDKSTLANISGNVHRICTPCHNRWHALNDPYYGERPEHGGTYTPLSGKCLDHDSETKATDLERFTAEIYWQSKIADRKEYRPDE